MTTARDITAALRALWPVPVSLSVRTDNTAPGWQRRFLVRLPSAAANSWRDPSGEYRWMEQFLGRRTGQAVTVVGARDIRRRDYGRDVEFTVQVNG